MKPAAFQMFSETGWAYTFMSIAGMDHQPRACAVRISRPSGISYQILTKGDTPDSGYMVHALNTVYVDDERGWVRLDARGNKNGVDARFSLDEERLAYVVRPEYGERDLNDNHPDADPGLMKLIQESGNTLAVSSEAVLDRFR